MGDPSPLVHPSLPRNFQTSIQPRQKHKGSLPLGALCMSFSPGVPGAGAPLTRSPGVPGVGTPLTRSASRRCGAPRALPSAPGVGASLTLTFSPGTVEGERMVKNKKYRCSVSWLYLFVQHPSHFFVFHLFLTEKYCC